MHCHKCRHQNHYYHYHYRHFLLFVVFIIVVILKCGSHRSFFYNTYMFMSPNNSVSTDLAKPTM